MKKLPKSLLIFFAYLFDFKIMNLRGIYGIDAWKKIKNLQGSWIVKSWNARIPCIRKTGPNIILYPTLLKILLSKHVLSVLPKFQYSTHSKKKYTLQHFSSLSNTYVAMLKSIPKGLGYFCDHRLQNLF